MKMRAPILGLAVASAAFASSSLYFWNQLETERAHAAQVEEASRQLNARVAELEKARAEFTQRRMAGMVTGRFGSFGPHGAPPTVVTSSDIKTPPGAPAPVFNTHRMPTSPAFQKMMRAQVRAMTRRQYADVGEKLGLSKETTAKLIDLLTEQQSASIPGPGDYPDAPHHYDLQGRDQEQAISDLIGPEKAQAFKDYQETIPARMESEMLARQLDENGVPLSDAQRKQLVDVVIEERARVPMPEPIEGMDPTVYAKSLNDWRDDYEKRLGEQAGHILNSEQMTTYNDITQWQKDIREQAATMGIANVPASPRNGRVVQGDNIMFSTSVPVGAVVVTGGATATQEPKKP